MAMLVVLVNGQLSRRMVQANELETPLYQTNSTGHTARIQNCAMLSMLTVKLYCS